MASIRGQANTYQRPQRRRPANRTSTPCWQTGDVAFLKQAEAFNETERRELLDSRRVPTNATGHPVIILAKSDDSRYYIVTTVSAYKSGEDNNFLPPWKQEFHKRKDIGGFRAFEGSERPNKNFEFLRLADGKKWPKEKTSWVYIHNPSLVPVTTLLRYTKPRTDLRMEPASLQDLLGHMEAKSRKFCEQKVEMAKRTPTQPAQKPQQQKVEIVVKTTPTQPTPANLKQQTAEIVAKRAPNLPVVRNLHRNWRQNGKENASFPVVSHTDGASENPKPSDSVVEAAKSIPVFSSASVLKPVVLA
ncbi:hypothetical protein CIB48_g4698 [Xylaria polymorpha]|nr:hypothetical protein CIB48_g4698 [Xylaria polymorpha]